MTKNEFLEEIQELLQRETPVELDTALADVAEWDSLAMMGIASFFNTTFSLRISRGELLAMQTIGDIAKAAGLDL